MPANRYRFVELWDLPGYTPEQVYEVIVDAALLPEWWTGVFLEAEHVGQGPHPAVGGKARVVARGFLPYKVRFTIEAVELVPGKLVRTRTTGDFSGEGRATITATSRGTQLETEWRATVNKPAVRFLSPALRPIFALNHYWTTPKGVKGLLRYLGKKHGPSRST